MKKTLLLFTILSCTAAFGQSLKPEVVATSGTSFNNGTSQLDWTLGETATATLTVSSDMITQGFHQPQLIVTSIKDAANAGVSVFPNPTLDHLNIDLKNTSNTLIELYSIEGKLLDSRTANAQQMQIDMTNYAAGNYLLCIKEVGGITSTFKIIKSN